MPFNVKILQIHPKMQRLIYTFAVHGYISRGLNADSKPL